MRTREKEIKVRKRKSIKQKQRDRRRNQIKHWAKIRFVNERKLALKEKDVNDFIATLQDKAQEKSQVNN